MIKTNNIIIDFLVDKKLNYTDKGVLMVLLMFGGSALDSIQIDEILYRFGNYGHVTYSTFKRLIKYGYIQEDRTEAPFKYCLPGEMPKGRDIKDFNYTMRPRIARIVNKSKKIK